MSDRIRTTISVSPEVHDIFKRMAEAGGMSVSRCMGDWLADTAEGAELIATKMAEARRAPMAVMREMQAMVAGLADTVDMDMQKVRKMAAAGMREATGPKGTERSAARPRASAALTPPSSNTGVLVPPRAPKSPTPRSKKT
jgi:hypothetical protein